MRNGRHPLIFIISDDTKGESVESRLFPSDLKFTLRITNIRYVAKILTFRFTVIFIVGGIK